MGAALRRETPVPVLQLLQAEAELSGPVSGSEDSDRHRGFPHSGNTFAVVAFEQAQREMERVNAKFGTGFSSFVHSEDNGK